MFQNKKSFWDFYCPFQATTFATLSTLPEIKYPFSNSSIIIPSSQGI
jgi:hypothetical protein